MKNIFTAKKNDIKQRRKGELEAAISIAQDLIKDPKFKMYKEKYFKLKDTVEQDMLSLKEIDLKKYALNVRDISVRLDVLGKLLKDVERDAHV